MLFCIFFFYLDYLAPEILLGMEHGTAVDWWAVGVITFEFLTGIPPFNNNAKSPQEIFQRILAHVIPWPDVEDLLSPEAKSFISQLLIFDQKVRLGSGGSFELTGHSFFNTGDNQFEKIAAAPAPFIPSLPDLTDTSYFEGEVPKFV